MRTDQHIIDGKLLLLMLPFALLSGCAMTDKGNVWIGARVWKTSQQFSPEKIEKVAVIAEDRSGWNESRQPRRGSTISLARAVEDQFMESLLKRGYRVADRSDIDKVKHELAQQGGPLNEAQTIQLGRHINASALVLVTINSASVSQESYEMVDQNGSRRRETFWQAHATVGGRMIGVETGEVLGVGSYSSSVNTRTPYDPLPAVTHAADVVASSIPKRTVMKLE